MNKAIQELILALKQILKSKPKLTKLQKLQKKFPTGIIPILANVEYEPISTPPKNNYALNGDRVALEGDFEIC